MKTKSWLSLLTIVILAVSVIFYCLSNLEANPVDSVSYRNGVFEGSSRSIYTEENFWGKVKITIEKGKFTKVEFQIIKDENDIFNEFYENNYIGNSQYMQQCRLNWKGVQTYPQLLLDKQNIDQIDAITGATWSFNLFKDSTKAALEKMPLDQP